jgi:hypothetical protein
MTPSGTINPEVKFIAANHAGVAFSVKHDELRVPPFTMIDKITSFYVTIKNRTANEVSSPPGEFLLKDGDGRQYRAIPSKQVREIIINNTVYLVPSFCRLLLILKTRSDWPMPIPSRAHCLSMRSTTPENFHPCVDRGANPWQLKGLWRSLFFADLEKTGYAELQLLPMLKLQ